jgi:hypothetical protein
MPKCKNCQDVRWTCENHQDVPWAGMTNEPECCGGAGMPCPKCNPCDKDNPPANPPGFEVIAGPDEKKEIH